MTEIRPVIEELVEQVQKELDKPENKNYSEYFHYKLSKVLTAYSDRIEAIQEAPCSIEVLSPTLTKKQEWEELSLSRKNKLGNPNER